MYDYIFNHHKNNYREDIKWHTMTQINKVIKSRLQQFAVPNDAIQIENVAFLFAETAPDLLSKLEQEIRLIFAHE